LVAVFLYAREKYEQTFENFLLYIFIYDMIGVEIETVGDIIVNQKIWLDRTYRQL
jgi:hypothetical protein